MKIKDRIKRWFCEFEDCHGDLTCTRREAKLTELCPKCKRKGWIEFQMNSLDIEDLFPVDGD